MRTRAVAVLHDSLGFGGHEKAFLTWLPAVIESPRLRRLDFWIYEGNDELGRALQPFLSDRVRLFRHPFAKKPLEPLRAWARWSYARHTRAFVRSGGYDRVLLLQGRIENLATPMTWLGRNIELFSYVPMAHGTREMGKRGLAATLADASKSRLYRRPDRWITPSEAVAAQLRRAGARSQIIVVENVPAAQARKPQARPRQGDERTALFIGRFDGLQKGLDLLVEALKADPKGFAGWRFVFVGTGPFLPHLEALKRTSGLQIEIHGWTQDVVSYLEAAHVLLMPSRFEGVPLVMLEAFGSGTPVLGSDIDVFREYLPPEGVHDFRQSAALRQAMDALTTEPARRAYRMHAQAVLARLDPQRSREAFAEALLG